MEEGHEKIAATEDSERTGDREKRQHRRSLSLSSNLPTLFGNKKKEEPPPPQAAKAEASDDMAKTIKKPRAVTKTPVTELFPTVQEDLELPPPPAVMIESLPPLKSRSMTASSSSQGLIPLKSNDKRFNRKTTKIGVQQLKELSQMGNDELRSTRNLPDSVLAPPSTLPPPVIGMETKRDATVGFLPPPVIGGRVVSMDSGGGRAPVSASLPAPQLFPPPSFTASSAPASVSVSSSSTSSASTSSLQSDSSSTKSVHSHIFADPPLSPRSAMRRIRSTGSSPSIQTVSKPAVAPSGSEGSEKNSVINILNDKLSTRPSREELQTRNVYMPQTNRASAGSHQSGGATWTSKPPLKEEWSDEEIELDGSECLLDPSCYNANGSNFNVDEGKHSVANIDVEEISSTPLLDCDEDVCYFQQFLFSKTKVVHFAGQLGYSKGSSSNSNSSNSSTSNTAASDQITEELPVLITIEKNNQKKFQRAIIRTPVADERVLISANSSKANRMLRALIDQRPFIREARLVKIPSEIGEELSKALVQYECAQSVRQYKFGILYSRGNQKEEDEMMSNRTWSKGFTYFLNLLGETVKLQGWNRFRGGLDVKNGTTGENSIYTLYKGFELMFHVSTLLPFSTTDPQQLERKRHLGNDVVTIIYRDVDNVDSGDTDILPFDPKTMRSQFNHVWAVIRPVYGDKSLLEIDTKCMQGLDDGNNNENSPSKSAALNGSEEHDETTNSIDNISYRVSFVCKSGVPPFRPYYPYHYEFKDHYVFREFLLKKLVNAERAAMHAKSFKEKIARTRTLMLNELIEKYALKDKAKK